MRRSVYLVTLAAIPFAACKIDESPAHTACFLGGCPFTPTTPEFGYAIAGLPAALVTDQWVAQIPVGDSLDLVLVRVPYVTRCGVRDTLTLQGTWTVTKPFGGAADSSVATIEARANGHAMLRAKAIGSFGLLFVGPDSAPDGAANLWRQSVLVCPGEVDVLDFRVVP